MYSNSIILVAWEIMQFKRRRFGCVIDSLFSFTVFPSTILRITARRINENELFNMALSLTT